MSAIVRDECRHGPHAHAAHAGGRQTAAPFLGVKHHVLSAGLFGPENDRQRHHALGGMDDLASDVAGT